MNATATKETKGILKDVPAIVFGIDNTLARGSIADAQVRSFMKLEKAQGGESYRGIWILHKSFRGLARVFFSGERMEGQALKQANIFMIVARMDEVKMRIFARGHLLESKIHSSYNLANEFKLAGRPIFAATLGGSTGADATREYYGMEGHVANTDSYKPDGTLMEQPMFMRNGEQKLGEVKSMLRDRGLDISEVAAVGALDSDIPMLKAARVALASPEASRAVRKMAHVHLPKHGTSLDRLNFVAELMGRGEY